DSIKPIHFYPTFRRDHNPATHSPIILIASIQYEFRSYIIKQIEFSLFHFQCGMTCQRSRSGNSSVAHLMPCTYVEGLRRRITGAGITMNQNKKGGGSKGGDDKSSAGAGGKDENGGDKLSGGGDTESVGSGGKKPGSAGASTREAALKVLQLSQKGEWPPVDQALKALEKIVAQGGEDTNTSPLLGVIDPASGMTPLMYAVKDNRAALLDRMIDMGADVCARNNNRRH
ncbi:hypothetical protein L9F63_013158, partial [Diploptera punctata]